MENAGHGSQAGARVTTDRSEPRNGGSADVRYYGVIMNATLPGVEAGARFTGAFADFSESLSGGQVLHGESALTLEIGNLKFETDSGIAITRQPSFKFDLISINGRVSLRRPLRDVLNFFVPPKANLMTHYLMESAISGDLPWPGIYLLDADGKAQLQGRVQRLEPESEN